MEPIRSVSVYGHTLPCQGRVMGSLPIQTAKQEYREGVFKMDKETAPSPIKRNY